MMASPKVKGPDGAAPLPIDTKGCCRTKARSAPFSGVGTARRRRPTPCGEARPHLREAAMALLEVKGPDGAAPPSD